MTLKTIVACSILAATRTDSLADRNIESVGSNSRAANQPANVDFPLPLGRLIVAMDTSGRQSVVNELLLEFQQFHKNTFTQDAPNHAGIPSQVASNRVPLRIIGVTPLARHLTRPRFIGASSIFV